MTLNRIRSLQPAVDIAHDREEQAAREMAETNRRFHEDRQRLEQLLTFRREYTEQMENAGRGGISARRLQDYSDFIGNLDRNIALMGRHLEKLEGEAERKRHAWLAVRVKAQALEGMVEKLKKEQGQVEERREQNESDERALRLGPMIPLYEH